MMVKSVRWMVCLVVAGVVSPAFGQWAENMGKETDWQVSFISGFLSGGTYLRTNVGGEPVEVELDNGWLIGVRFGAEQEYVGWEVSVSGVFADMDLKADPATMLPSAQDASLLLASVNFLWFPIGGDWADGRVRPFLTIGPGLAHLDSDFSEADGKTMFATNLGAGLKFLLGDHGNPVLRVDWRWHYMVGETAGLENQIYRQELSAGIGFRF